MTPPTVASVVVRESDVDAYVAMREEVEAAATVEARRGRGRGDDGGGDDGGGGADCRNGIHRAARGGARRGACRRCRIPEEVRDRRRRDVVASVWEANDPNFPSCDIRWRKNIEEEKSKSEALNEEWTERLMTVKGEFRQRIDELHADLEREANATLMREQVEASESQREQLERAVGDVDALRSELDGVRGEKIELSVKSSLFAPKSKACAAKRIGRWVRLILCAAKRTKLRVKSKRFAANWTVRALKRIAHGARSSLFARIRIKPGLKSIRPRRTRRRARRKDRAWSEVQSLRDTKSNSELELEEKLRSTLECKDEAIREKNELQQLLANLRAELEANAELRESPRDKVAEDQLVEELRSEIERLRAESDSAIENATHALGKYAELDSVLPEIITAIDRSDRSAHGHRRKPDDQTHVRAGGCSTDGTV